MQLYEAVRILAELYADDTKMERLCHANQDELYAYVDAELNNLPVATLYPLLHSQLATCESCRLVYEDLKALLTMERNGTLVQPPVPASFDFTYLTQSVGAGAKPVSANRVEKVVDHILWHLTDVGRLVMALSAEFVQSLQLDAPQPAFLKSTANDLFAVSSPDIADDLRVTVTARAKRRDPERCTITVTADIPSRNGWPHLGGTAVTVMVGGREVETLSTDAYGKVIFADIDRNDLAQLVLTVTPSAPDDSVD
jgi:hypothetical protein